MEALKIEKMGSPVLKQKSALVTFPLSEAQLSFIESMKTCCDQAGGVGLAAPQVGVLEQIVVVRASPFFRDLQDQEDPYVVLCNPTLFLDMSTQIGGWEGCLSLPDLTGYVMRAQSLICDYQMMDGSRKQFSCDDWAARILQHECDHLLGILYPQRMTDLSLLGYKDIINK